MGQVMQDVRFALRMLRKNWGVSLVAVASLSVAIGGNTAVFALVNTLLFQPISVEAPERLVVVQERRSAQPEGLSTLTTSLATQADLAERSRTTADWTALRPTVLGLRDGERSEPIQAAEVAPNFFEVLGIQPSRGRAFAPEEGVPGGRKVAIVTPEFWERNRGGVGEPLGAVLTLNGEPVEVVGVMPEAFTFLFSVADIFIPITDSPTSSPRDRRDVVGIARMAPSATMTQVRAEMSELASQLAIEYPEIQRDRTIDAFNARTDIPDGRTKIFYALLQGSVFFVLLIACVNIANLLLARSQERSREIALRTVLGAGRRRIAFQLLTESGILVTLGAGLGLAFGWVGIKLLANQFAGFLPANYTPALDGTVVVFTAGISVAAGIFFGVAPAFQTLRRSQVDALKEGGGKATSSRSRRLVTRGLVVAEIALSLVALGGGGMMVRAFMDLQGADPGFDGSGLATARLGIPASKYPDADERWAFLEEALEASRGLEGVESVALVNVLPRNFQAPLDTFAIPGQPRDAAVPAPEAISLRATPDYVEALGIEVVRGRFFEAADGAGSAPVAVVNRSFAERWLQGEDFVGQSIIFAGDTREIVGLVEDVQQVIVSTPGQVQSEAVYIPAAQDPTTGYTMVVATNGDPGAVKEPVRTALQRLDPDVTLSQVLTMDEFVEQFFVGIEVFNSILGGFGILAILLAALGTYGVLAYQVTQRKHEIGIRMAIGAKGSTVVTMVTRQGAAMALLGLALGGLLLVPLTGLLKSILAGFVTVTTSTAFVVAAVLFAVTLVASLVPAYRAAGLDPVRALRDE